MKWLLIALLIPTFTMAQTSSEGLPYEEIPDFPNTYISGNVLARFVDGLGYRYYWATEGLREEDLAYQIEPGSRSTRQTLDHIYRLTQGIASASEGVANQAKGGGGLTFEELREGTLENIKRASANFASKSAEEISELAVIFKSQYKTVEYPLWNLMNGQISDALYHTGQIVSYRRASGNPLNPKVDVFQGKNRP